MNNDKAWLRDMQQTPSRKIARNWFLLSAFVIGASAVIGLLVGLVSR